MSSPGFGKMVEWEFSGDKELANLPMEDMCMVKKAIWIWDLIRDTCRFWSILPNILKPDKHPSHRKKLLKFRSEEHTSELQSRGHLVCRRLLDNKQSRY